MGGSGEEKGGVTGDQIARKGREREREGVERERNRGMLDNAVLIRSPPCKWEQLTLFIFC